mmetsp:Transcript_81364/g.178890  ORF Transcript_81364/g.178890 Transcript_81364/m.178890 type:complete len:209 (+) Transcript_81364:447-1073(+)
MYDVSTFQDPPSFLTEEETATEDSPSLRSCLAASRLSTMEVRWLMYSVLTFHLPSSAFFVVEEATAATNAGSVVVEALFCSPKVSTFSVRWSMYEVSTFHLSPSFRVLDEVAANTSPPSAKLLLLRPCRFSTWLVRWLMYDMSTFHFLSPSADGVVAIGFASFFSAAAAAAAGAGAGAAASSAGASLTGGASSFSSSFFCCSCCCCCC